MALHDLEQTQRRAAMVSQIINILMDAKKEGIDPHSLIDEAMVLFASPTSAEEQDSLK